MRTATQIAHAASQYRCAVPRTPPPVVSRCIDCIAMANHFHSYPRLANQRLFPPLTGGVSGASKVL